MVDINELRKVNADDLKHMPDGIQVYVSFKDSNVQNYNGWYSKIAHHLQSQNSGFIDIENKNFDFYVKFSYSLPVALQILFEVAVELDTGFEQKSNKELSEKIHSVINEIDKMRLW